MSLNAIGIASSHPLSNLEDEPAEKGESEQPEERYRDHSLPPFRFLQDAYDLIGRMASNNFVQ